MTSWQGGAAGKGKDQQFFSMLGSKCQLRNHKRSKKITEYGERRWGREEKYVKY